MGMQCGGCGQYDVEGDEVGEIYVDVGVDFDVVQMVVYLGGCGWGVVGVVVFDFLVGLLEEQIGVDGCVEYCYYYQQGVVVLVQLWYDYVVQYFYLVQLYYGYYVYVGQQGEGQLFELVYIVVVVEKDLYQYVGYVEGQCVDFGWVIGQQVYGGGYGGDVGGDVQCVGCQQQGYQYEQYWLWEGLFYVGCQVLVGDVVDVCVDDLDGCYQWQCEYQVLQY